MATHRTAGGAAPPVTLILGRQTLPPKQPLDYSPTEMGGLSRLGAWVVTWLLSNPILPTWASTWVRRKFGRGCGYPETE